MTDYERVTTRETTAVDPVADPMTPGPAVASTVRTTDRAYVEAGPSGATTAARIVTFAFGILQALLILRIVLLLLGANESNDLVAMIISITNPFVEPFRGMFNFDEINAAGGSVFDLAAVVALIAWTLVEALVLGIVGLADRRTTTVA